MIIREVTTEEEFARLAPSWEALYTQGAAPVPFQTWDWAWQWWKNLAAPDTLAYALRIVLLSEPDGTLVGIAPFYHPTRRGRLLCLRPLRLLGTHIRCLGEDVTDEPILLLAAGREEAALRALLAYLARAQPVPWDLTQLRLMRRREAAGLAEAWAAVRPAAGRAPAHLRSQDGQHVPLAESWPAFRQGLSKSMRDNLSYYPRLLTRHGHPWAIRTARTPTEVAAAAEALVRLHHARADSAAGTPHHDHLPTPSHARFLGAVLPALAARGRASVALLEIGGVPVAAQAVLEDPQMVTFHYSGFDPAWAAYSPVTLLNARVLEDAIARGVPLANYLPEAEPWKTRWGATALFVRDELSWVAPRPRSLARLLRRSLLRARHRSPLPICDCGFCTLPLTSGTETSRSKRKDAPQVAVS